MTAGSRKTILKRGLWTIGTVGLAMSIASSGSLAQDSSATPEASTVTVAATATNATAVEKVQTSEAVGGLTALIASVQTDRDALASSIDVTEVDGLIAKATELRDGVQASLDGDDLSSAGTDLFRGAEAANAARQLIEAEASAYGLPSQQSGASRALVRAYYVIEEAAKLTTPDEDPYFVETAERLYQRAFEYYNAGRYAQAQKTADVAQVVASAGLFEVEMADPMAGGAGFPVDPNKPGTMRDAPELRVTVGEFATVPGAEVVREGGIIEPEGHGGGPGESNALPAVIESGTVVVEEGGEFGEVTKRAGNVEVRGATATHPGETPFVVTIDGNAITEAAIYGGNIVANGGVLSVDSTSNLPPLDVPEPFFE